mmetsp:Transcript_17705/g.71062  ORF Transcript_17705/g.71062 Transcript_17705/m.71062 type:complete len:262 (+) Transcript_17705:541-1326(+)
MTPPRSTERPRVGRAEAAVRVVGRAHCVARARLERPQVGEDVVDGDDRRVVPEPLGAGAALVDDAHEGCSLVVGAVVGREKVDADGDVRADDAVAPVPLDLALRAAVFAASQKPLAKRRERPVRPTVRAVAELERDARVAPPPVLLDVDEAGAGALQSAVVPVVRAVAVVVPASEHGAHAPVPQLADREDLAILISITARCRRWAYDALRRSLVFFGDAPRGEGVGEAVALAELEPRQVERVAEHGARRRRSSSSIGSTAR